MLQGKDGAAWILEERENQKNKWSDKHDDTHANGELGIAAAALILLDEDPGSAENMWPWDEKALKKYSQQGRIDQLIAAGALIAAELDRYLRGIGY